MNIRARQFLTPTFLALGAGILSGRGTPATHPEAYTAWKPLTNATVVASLSDKKDSGGKVTPFKERTVEWGNGTRVIYLAPNGRRVNWTGKQVIPKGKKEPVWETVARTENRWLISNDGKYCTDTVVPPAKGALDADGKPATAKVQRSCSIARAESRLNKTRFLNHYGGLRFEATTSGGNTRNL
jgi:hypothetical protein